MGHPAYQLMKDQFYFKTMKLAKFVTENAMFC